MHRAPSDYSDLQCRGGKSWEETAALGDLATGAQAEQMPKVVDLGYAKKFLPIL